MKTRNLMIIALMMALGMPRVQGQGLSATEIVRQADEKLKGEHSSYSLMTMTIVRPEWERTLTFKSWTMEKDFALALITAPAREAGQTFLKRESEMWRWDPTINRLIKLPPSMMSQGWMGSDYTNDDILRESSIVNDYTHEILGEERMGGRLCYKIRLTAREDADIVWGKQIQWIDKEDFLVMKTELYDEFGYLVRTETASNIQVMDGRTIPTRIELVPEEEPDNRTIVEIREIRFNISIDEGFFSQQNMQRVR